MLLIFKKFQLIHFVDQKEAFHKFKNLYWQLNCVQNPREKLKNLQIYPWRHLATTFETRGQFTTKLAVRMESRWALIELLCINSFV
jgi:hypothetical protein